MANYPLQTSRNQKNKPDRRQHTVAAGAAHMVATFSERGSWSSEWRFSAVFSAIIAYCFIRYPSLTYHSEVFSEEGCNFFNYAYHLNLWINLRATDAQYLPMIQRLVALVLVKGFGLVGGFAVVANLFALVFLAACCASVALKRFRAVIPMDIVRVAIGLVLGLGLIAEYDDYTFVNFTYWGVVPAFMLLFVDMAKLPRWSFGALSFLVMLLCISKAYFVVLFPIYAVGAWFMARAKRWRQFALCAFGLLGTVIQAGFLLWNQHVWKDEWHGAPPTQSPLQMAWNAVLAFSQSYMQFRLTEAPELAVMRLLAVAGFIATAGYVLYRRAPRPAFWFFAGAQALGFITVAFTAKTQGSFPLDIGPHLSTHVLIGRHFIFSSTFILLALGCSVACLRPYKWVWWYTLAMAVLFVMGLAVGRTTQLGQLIPSDPFSDSCSQWNRYSQLLTNKDDYVVPINPYPWTLLCGNKPLIRGNTGPNLVSDINLGPTSTDWQVKAISFVLAYPPADSLPSLKLSVFDSQTNELPTPDRLSPSGSRYLFYYFPAHKPVSRVVFTTLEGKPFPIAAEIIVFGKGTGVVRDFESYGYPPDAPSRRWLP